MSNSELSDRQLTMLRYIAQCIDANGYAPTVREIGEAMRIKSAGHITYHLYVLEKRGYISRIATKARTIRVLKMPASESESAA